MKPERFKRTKSVMASGAIALVVAALVIGVSSLVLGPRSASPAHPGFDLTSGGSSFTITSNIYGSSCSGATVSLYPNTADCAVFTVQNLLNVPITVQSITTALDTHYPAPLPQCAPPTYLTLPTFSGSATVGASATANLPGVPIELKDDGSPDQTACENFQYRFTYTGGAQYTDSTTNALTSSPNPANSGQSVTFTATVTAGNPSTDASLPSGTVSFYSCPTSAQCAYSSSNLLGSGTIGAGGMAPFSTTSLPTGTTYVEAVYPASGTNFTASTSNVVAQVVNSATTHGSTSHLTSSPNPSNFGQSVTFTDTVSGSSGTPTGMVTFYNCGSSSNCSSKSAFGSAVTLSSGKAIYSTTALPVGTTYVEAIYGGSGTYQGSTSNILAQVVNALGTTSVLTSSPNPSVPGTSVSFTDTVSSSSGTPGGTVTFYRCTTNSCSTKTSLGAETLSGGKATYSTSTLPLGTTYVEAIYGATGNYLGSTSNVLSQLVVSVPSVCASGGYGTYLFGNPVFPFLNGTNGSDFLYAFGGDYWINGFNGNDCIDAGDGNNFITDGDGNDGISAGNGSNSVLLGNGNDKVSLGNGSDGVWAGNGTDSVTLGNGSHDSSSSGAARTP